MKMLLPEIVYLLKLLLILFPVALLHVPFLGFGTAECDEALETLQIFMLVWRIEEKKNIQQNGKSFILCHHIELELKSTIVLLTGLNCRCIWSIQSDGFVWLCPFFRGGFWRWIWQSPSHNDLLYVQNLRVHPGIRWS